MNQTLKRTSLCFNGMVVIRELLRERQFISAPIKIICPRANDRFTYEAKLSKGKMYCPRV